MPISEVLEELRFDADFIRDVAVWERLPAQPAQYADYPANLRTDLIELVRQQGYAPLYSHQARAVEAVLNGEHTVIVTATASGKSLAYNLPALQFMLNDPRASALYLFPTKALARDQAAGLAALVEALETDLPLGVYDGDTPSGQRTAIRKRGGVVISNPDMLHVGILPYHTRWVSFFQNLRLVVLDELHTYRGVFGSHMANVLRRLRRLCHFYGSDPVFVMASATIANPLEHAEALLGEPVTLVDNDGAPRGERHIILYNPPVIDKATGIRRSYTLETRRIAGRLLAGGVQTAVFARSRLTTELLLGYLRDEVAAVGGPPSDVRGYRGGYLPTERRTIEAGLREGVVRGVVATNALELGVDIGALGGAVLAGYPGTIASTWQQIGRAGRREDVSVGILVASGAPLDQYVIAHPRYLFDTPPEHALINPDNLLILADHVRCAVYELPFAQGEPFGPFDDVHELLDILAEEGSVHPSGGMYRWVSGDYPAAEFSLRAGSGDTVVIQVGDGDSVAVIGEVDRPQAPISVHEGAIYMHEGQQYTIEALDWENGVAKAAATEADYYTRAGSSTTIAIEEEEESALEGDVLKAFGRLAVTIEATGYRVIKLYTHETLGYETIDLPAQTFETAGYWMSLTPDLVTQLAQQGIMVGKNNYGPNWAEQRHKARIRDSFRCRRCGTPEPEHREHDVHHIRAFKEFGYMRGVNDAYQDANRLENLLTLCPSCHHTIEAEQRTQSAMGGAANVLKNVATLFLMCSPNDIGVTVEQRSPHTRAPTITVYDMAAGGLGLAVRLFDLHEEIMHAAYELVRDCPCEEGCPVCVGPSAEVGSGTKALTQTLYAAVCGR
ncbi:MAG: DEAD/DEAH box helicase [Anaerolineae bacterium]